MLKYYLLSLLYFYQHSIKEKILNFYTFFELHCTSVAPVQYYSKITLFMKAKQPKTKQLIILKKKKKQCKKKNKTTKDNSIQLHVALAMKSGRAGAWDTGEYHIVLINIFFNTLLVIECRCAFYNENS